MIQIKCNGEEAKKLFGEDFIKNYLENRLDIPNVNVNENTCIVRNLSIDLYAGGRDQITMDLEILKMFEGNGMEKNESEIRK